MPKILIIFILGYVAWRVFSKAIGPQSSKGSGQGPDSTQMDADMVQDPQCGVYVTRQDAVVAELEGRTVYFCSQDCKQRYMAAHQAGRK